ncbi:ATP-dependent dethiobiotin synthetase BioD [Catenulispora sp. NF23]|uniref:ATP-dependent dethiobiotin synthetase BioD n=1 Tax=Catenulispora pinistramenti TaxID=2705254 RepID=A0ABS5L415_9ACTN|nr:dethiobiotin synthase [Catenulispora pinistramenti]MBS2537124.1 ATP-dependent dethiobiotin synthetase BioD [Catenulispora pinistramenti]MBS2553118.1 ATP-dependent dethiobiotin synthetase BioD [Catenulispora pinistramenti]
MSIVVVTGTNTDVGKTVVTAAVATLAAARGSSVAVVKPAQTGVTPDGPGDLATVRQLAGVTDLHEYVRYPDPLSPAAAARRSGIAPLDFDDTVRRIQDLAASRRLVLVEGAGGLLVRNDEDGSTLADLAHALKAPLLLVAHPSLGTLNIAALTLEAMAARGLDLAGIVLGSWPATPDLAMRSNIRDLETIGARPLAGALPAGAGRLDPADFLLAARAGLAPAFGGTFDPAEFRQTWDPRKAA